MFTADQLSGASVDDDDYELPSCSEFWDAPGSEGMQLRQRIELLGLTVSTLRQVEENGGSVPRGYRAEYCLADQPGCWNESPFVAWQDSSCFWRLVPES